MVQEDADLVGGGGERSGVRPERHGQARGRGARGLLGKGKGVHAKV